MLHAGNVAKAQNYRVRFFHKTTTFTRTFSRFAESGFAESGLNRLPSHSVLSQGGTVKEIFPNKQNHRIILRLCRDIKVRRLQLVDVCPYSEERQEKGRVHSYHYFVQ